MAGDTAADSSNEAEEMGAGEGGGKDPVTEDDASSDEQSGGERSSKGEAGERVRHGSRRCRGEYSLLVMTHTMCLPTVFT